MQTLRAPRRIILTYHSHHVIGPEYARNDHLALAHDLGLIADLGGRIVSLDALIAQPAAPERSADVPSSDLWVALTFDDGPAYDVTPFDHPELGRQPGFLAIMETFVARYPESRRDLCATSFVIASPAARQFMETSFDPIYTCLGPGSMSDEWWLPAIETGRIHIANHSWDHLHPALPEVAHSEQARADFKRVRSTADADRQIAEASHYIAAKTNGRWSPYFAYPFGHYNAFLVERYFPESAHHGIRAAFGCDPRPVDVRDNVWRLPRYVCGHDWHDPAELEALLSG